jgi:hypothetical protein
MTPTRSSFFCIAMLLAALPAQAPTIAFLAPANGATVLDTFVAAGSATNATVVELQVDGGGFRCTMESIARSGTGPT